MGQKHGKISAERKSNCAILIVISNLQPVLAGVLTALERHVNGEWNGEINEHRAVIAVADFKLIIFPAHA